MMFFLYFLIFVSGSVTVTCPAKKMIMIRPCERLSPCHYAFIFSVTNANIHHTNHLFLFSLTILDRSSVMVTSLAPTMITTASRCACLSPSPYVFFTSVMNSTIHHASHLFLFSLIFRKPGTSPIVPRFARASGKGQVDPAADPSTQGSSARDQDGLQG